MKFLRENIPGCDHFKWHEALYCPRWGEYIVPSEPILENIISTGKLMEAIRSIVKSPIKVTSWYRPAKYNELIGGAKWSMHKLGRAVDFVVEGQSVAQTKELLMPHLESLGIRMEQDNISRVHIDDKKPGKSGRYFLP